MNTAYLRLSQAELQLPQRTVSLPAVTLAAGEILAVMGPSGCGKSSWLRWLLGDQQAHLTVHGQIELAGHDMTAYPIERRGIGIVWQDFLLFPHLSVLENLQLALPAKLRKLPRRSQRQLIIQRLEQVELAALIEQPVTSLSGGQRARIALLRALINEPLLLLLDEPFAALDSDLRERMRAWTFTTLQAAGTSAIIVSHDRNDFPPACSTLIWPHGASND